MSGLVAKPAGLAFMHAPFAGDDARERLDLALALAAADWPLTLFFLGPGVQLLRPRAAADGIRDFPAALKTLVMFGVEQIYAETSALERYRLLPGELRIPVSAVSSQHIRLLMGRQAWLA